MTAEQPRLLIATNNAGKVDEFREILAGCGWQIVSPTQAGVSIDPEETGSTYSENARLKAEAFSKASGLPALADDSGLEVDALNGEPGALHHLHGWDGVDQADRIAILLRALEAVPKGERSARFRAVIVIVMPDGSVIEEEGTCEGSISLAVEGWGGFGYDPVFVPAGRKETMAQLGIEEKNRISHRAVAATRVTQRLIELAQP